MFIQGNIDKLRKLQNISKDIFIEDFEAFIKAIVRNLSI
jgi:hypothetical protein